MVREFKDKSEWALILGASSGLGLATAHKLAKHGLNLILCHRSRKSDMPSIEATFKDIKQKNGINVLAYNADITREDKQSEIINSIKESFTSKDRCKALIHSIAKGNLKPMVAKDLPSLQNDDFRLTIDSMGISLYDWTKKLFEEALFADDARVLSFTSEGNTKAWENYAAVSAAKVVLESITRSIALEFAPYGIKANCLQAGVTDTASLRMIPGNAILIEESIKRNPNNRLTQPEDVANAVYLLLKDEASWINGAIIPVNGGEHLR